MATRADEYDDYSNSAEHIAEHESDLTGHDIEMLKELIDQVEEEADTLDHYEQWASENNMISSEQELVDSYIDAAFDGDKFEAKVAFERDEIMENENFSNYADALCKDNVIHDLQYSEYEYTPE